MAELEDGTDIYSQSKSAKLVLKEKAEVATTDALLQAETKEKIK